MYIDTDVKCMFFRQILMKLEYSRQIFEKNILLLNFIKIRPVGAEVFHTNDKQTVGRRDRYDKANKPF